MMNRYVRMGLATVAVVAAFTGGTALLASSASATGTGERVCADWKARGATGEYPAITFGAKPAGTVISSYTAKLTKPTSGSNPGVEFASMDLKVGPLASATIVSVSYATSGGASVTAGAVRMFAYYGKDANTITDGPDHQDAAQSESGTLMFTVPAGKKIGTLGLVFDASNNTTGAITFSNLKIGERKVDFDCLPKIEKPIPTPTATVVIPPGHPSPSASASTTTPPVSPSASPSATETPDAVAAGGPTLPLTGAPVGLVFAAGGALLALGIGGLIVSRRRKVTYEA